MDGSSQDAAGQYKCPKCNAAEPPENGQCTVCGAQVAQTVAAAQAPSTSTGGEDFLKNILMWSSGENKEEPKPQENPAPQTSGDPFEELENELDLDDLNPKELNEEDNLKALEQAQNRMAEIEARESMLVSMKDPFEKALDADKERLEDMKVDLQRRVEDAEKGIGLDGKDKEELRKELEVEMKELDDKRNKLFQQQVFVMEMKKSNEDLITQQREELEAEKDNFKKRLEAFQKEVGRRKKERDELQKKKLSLSDRERQLMEETEKLARKEEDLKRKEGVLQNGEEKMDDSSGSTTPAEIEEMLGRQREILDLQSKLLSEIFKKDKTLVFSIVKTMAISKEDLRRLLT